MKPASIQQIETLKTKAGYHIRLKAMEFLSASSGLSRVEFFDVYAVIEPIGPATIAGRFKLKWRVRND